MLCLSLPVTAAFRSCPAQFSGLVIPAKVNLSELAGTSRRESGCVLELPASQLHPVTDTAVSGEEHSCCLGHLISVRGVSHAVLGGCHLPRVVKRSPCHRVSL